jgi:valyl-tRNA synthetase
MHLECRIAFLQHCDTTEIDPDNLHVRGSSLTVMETMSRLQECVIAIRHLRQQQGLSDGTLVDAYIEADIDSSHSEFITTMAKLSSLTFGKPARPSLSAIIQGGRIHVAIDGTVDISAFKVRVQKQLEDKQKSAAAKRIKLDNPGYIAKAKPELVDETRKLLAEDDAEIERLKDTLKELG